MSGAQPARTYAVVHRTSYRYSEPVTRSYGRTTLLPRDLPDQHVLGSAVTVDPAPADTDAHVDYFGNGSTYFAVTTPHRELVVTARSTVAVSRVAASVATLPDISWEDATRAARAEIPLREALLPSRHVALSAEVRAWSAPTFTPGRPLGEVLAELSHRIRTELSYRPGSTTVGTTQAEVLAQGAGVCQDFAHLMIAALRVHGLPARYASGYLETSPPPGRPKLRGADASHAWVSAWVPGAGWVEVDPTNDLFVGDRHVILGWGRDYADVPPLRGVIFTEGAGSDLTVSVDLELLSTDSSTGPSTV
ncbi:transglutaminase family protein [Cellulomonas timonensis]|uniref:transglutaminase family protein n=1 Tax=Cellulomonas timonensis TaxID=1689271 RepID=UPI0008346D1E|nr:transglutaminase family protein [Cellulomonas timonensis]